MSNKERDANDEELEQRLRNEVIALYKNRPELKNWYSLRNAVFERRYSDALSLLNEYPELIDVRDSIGETVLHFLAVENDLEGVAWLHDHGFTLDVRDNYGTPVIFQVAQLSYKDLLDWFKKNGANFLAKNKEGQDITEYLNEFENGEMVAYVNQIRT